MKPISKQRWLVIAHAFNMDGRAASQTITDKLPHLRDAGIEIVVLSGVSGVHDSQFEHYQLWPAGPAGLRFELRHVLRRRLGHGIRYRFVMTLASLFLWPGMLVEKLLRPVESSWSWWLSAYLKGRALVRQKPFDLVYSSGGAFAAHLAGRALKRATGTPWLAEVHDPLVMPGSLPDTPQQKMQARVEQLICSDADIAIWFTDQALASALARHPQLGECGKMMLPGVDKPFSALPPYQPGPKFVIGHFGSLSPTRHLGPVIQAMELISRRSPELLPDMELHLYGGPLDSVSVALLADSPVRQSVRHFGRIEADASAGLSGREQILRRMRSSDVLLLLHGEDAMCPEYIPSKLYEYLWMQRPIVATVYHNPQMADLIRGQGHVAVQTMQAEAAAIDRSNDLATALELLYTKWQTLSLADNGLTSPFTTKASVGQLMAWATKLPARTTAT